VNDEDRRKVIWTDSNDDLPEIVWSGDASNCIELVSDGGGEFPNGYRLTAQGMRVVARWLREHANLRDIEDCDACDVLEEDYCPVHYGIGIGSDITLQAIRDAVDKAVSC